MTTERTREEQLQLFWNSLPHRFIIFHSNFWEKADGGQLEPFSLVTVEMIETDKVRLSDEIKRSLSQYELTEDVVLPNILAFFRFRENLLEDAGNTGDPKNNPLRIDYQVGFNMEPELMSLKECRIRKTQEELIRYIIEAEAKGKLSKPIMSPVD